MPRESLTAAPTLTLPCCWTNLLRETPARRSLELSGLLADGSGMANVEVVVLNEAPFALIGRVIQQRRSLYSRDEHARVRFESLRLRQFFDFELMIARAGSGEGAG
jgi:hypothetical protein